MPRLLGESRGCLLSNSWVQALSAYPQSGSGSGVTLLEGLQGSHRLWERL